MEKSKSAKKVIEIPQTNKLHNTNKTIMELTPQKLVLIVAATPVKQAAKSKLTHRVPPPSRGRNMTAFHRREQQKRPPRRPYTRHIGAGSPRRISRQAPSYSIRGWFFHRQ